MYRVIEKDQLEKLTQEDCAFLYDTGELLVLLFEPAGKGFIEEVGRNAAAWIEDGDRVTVDARRFLEVQEWLVPMLTSEFLPKTVIVNPRRWEKDAFCRQLPLLTLHEFYTWPAVHLDYQGAFEIVFRHSTHYLHAQVSTTDFCNLHCGGCPFHGDDPRYGFKKLRAQRPKLEMSDDIYYSFIDQLPAGKDLLFCPSGELFVSKNAMERVRYARNRGLDVRILTNGMLLKDDIAKELVDLGVASIIFSVDGHRADLVEKIRCGSNFTVLMKHIHHLLNVRNEADSNMVIGVSCGLYEELQPFRDEIVTFWEERGIDNFSFFPEKLDFFVEDEMLEFASTGLGKSPPCFQNLLTMPVLTNGNIAPCNMHLTAEWSQHDSSWLMNIKENSIEEAVKYYREMRIDPKSPYRKNCSRCTAKFHCYMKPDQTCVSADAYSFTSRRIRGHAAFMKDKMK